MTVFMAALSKFVAVLVALILFGVLIFVHELGHFLLAKFNKIYVEEFAMGMGPTILSKQGKETLYSLRLFPIGGFCRMKGEDDDETGGDSFNDKSVLARISVVIAGPMMNFIFAFIMIFSILSTGAFVEPTVSGVYDNTPAQSAGLQAGDEIVSINGQRVGVYQDITLYMGGYTGGNIELKVLRDGEKITLNMTPEYSKEDGRWIMGFTSVVKTGVFSEKVEGYDSAGILETSEASFNTMIFYVKSVVTGFVRLFTLDISKDEVAGPIGIIDAIGDSYETGLKDSIVSAILNVISIGALLSANLGVVNLFPIPAMDGGRLAFLIVEGLRGKPIDRQKEGMIHFIGFVLLMLFAIFIAFNDVQRIFM